MPCRISTAIVTTGGRPDIEQQTIEAACGLNGFILVWHNLDGLTPRSLSQGVNDSFNTAAADGGESDILVHLDEDALITDPGEWDATIPTLFDANPELGLLLPNGANYQEHIPRGAGSTAYREVRWGLGFAWAIRKSLFLSIGGYDPQLVHQQECDLAVRVRMAGYTVGASDAIQAVHNDPGGERSEMAIAREHIGCVQFRDKWTSYFRGAGWSYGTMPLYLMQHWPPDQEWYRRYAAHWGVELNPPPTWNPPPGAVLGVPAVSVGGRRIDINGMAYLVYADLRNDYGYWATGDGYLEDRQKAIDRWRELAGQEYLGYQWSREVTSHLGGSV